MNARVGPALGEAACHAEDAWRSLVRMALVLDSVDLAVTPELAGLIEDVADVSAGFIQLADDFGHAETARRQATRRSGVAA